MTLSRLADSALARSQTRGPLASAASMLSLFFAGECLLKLNGGGARGNTNPHRSRFCFCPLCGRPVAREIHPSASASGLFPLWLRAPRFLCAPLFLAFPPCSAGARASLLFGGGKESLPQLLLILVPSDSVVAQPPPSFSFVRQWCRFRYEIPHCRRTSALVPSPWTLIAETAPRRMQMLAPPSRARMPGLQATQGGRLPQNPLVLPIHYARSRSYHENYGQWSVCSILTQYETTA